MIGYSGKRISFDGVAAVAICGSIPTIVRMLRWFRTQVLSRRPVTFLVLGISFLAFAAGTVNLGMLLIANLTLISQHGWLALREGAAIQLLELLASTYVSMIAYIVFKCCELRLSRWVVDGA